MNNNKYRTNIKRFRLENKSVQTREILERVEVKNHQLKIKQIQ